LDLTAIIYAAIGGGVGGLLARLCVSLFLKSTGDSDPEKTAKKGAGLGGGLAGGLVVAGALILPALYKNMVLPRIIPLDETEFLEGDPIYKVIKEQSPEDYKRMIVPLDRASRNGNATQEDLDNIRVVLFELMAEKMIAANANILRDVNDVSILQAEIYKEKQPSICTLTFNGEPYPDVSDILNEDVSKLEQGVMMKLFTEPPRDSNFVPDLERGEKLITNIAIELAEQTGLNNIRPPIIDTLENRLEHQKVCEFSILFSKKQNQLSDEDLFSVKAYLETAE